MSADGSVPLPACVAVVGASPDPGRYSHQACLRFRERGYRVVPVHPRAGEVAGLACVPDLASLPCQPDIVCMYVNPTIGLGMLDAICAVKPRLLWLNPGADGPALAAAARARGLRVIEACSLVMLAQGDPLAILAARGYFAS